MRSITPKRLRKRKDREKDEKTIEKYLVRQCALRNWDAWKLTSPGRRGVPDRLILAEQGVMVMVECKRPVGGKLSPIQGRTIDRLSKKGFGLYVISTTDEVDAIMEMIGNKILSARGSDEFPA